MIPCPGCSKPSIYPILPEETASATTCQNPECRVVVNRYGKVVGRWDVAYKVLEANHA